MLEKKEEPDKLRTEQMHVFSAKMHVFFSNKLKFMAFRCSFENCESVTLKTKNEILAHALEVHGCCYQGPVTTEGKPAGVRNFNWQCSECLCIFDNTKQKGFKSKTDLVDHFKLVHPNIHGIEPINIIPPHTIKKQRVEETQSQKILKKMVVETLVLCANQRHA